MSKKRQTIRTIASEALLDPEELLLLVWEQGFEYLTSVDTPINSKDLKNVSMLFDVPVAHQITRKSYWKKLLGLSDDGLRIKLTSLGFSWNPRSIRVPRGAIRVLQKEKKNTLLAIRENEAARSTTQKLEIPTQPQLIWDEIGHLPPDGSIKFLSVDEIKEIHYELARDFERYSDPIIPVGVKSESLLASAAFRPNTSIGDSLKYPTIEMASAALIHSIIHNHPFHNGNKRTGLVSMIAMMDENGLIFECDEDELFRQVVRIAKHGITDFHPQDRDDREVLAIASWLNSKSRFIRKGDNPVPIRKLRNILSGFGCNIGDRQAGKILITRTIESSGRFRFRRNTNVSFILHSWTDGDEISPYDISKLRHELKLDEENAVDSTTFYDTGEITVDGFIRAYRKTLRRLSKM